MRLIPSRLRLSFQVALNLTNALEKGTACGWAIILLANNSPAEEPNAVPEKPPPGDELRLEKLLTLEIPMVESPSKYSQKSTEAPASVTVITADEVKKYGYRTLADILE